MNRNMRTVYPGIVSTSIVLIVVSWGAFAGTDSEDSDTGALETIRPCIERLTAVSGASLEVSFSEPMRDPGVSTPEHYTVCGLGAGTLSAHPTMVDGSEIV